MIDAKSRKVSFHTCTILPHNAKEGESGFYPVPKALASLHGCYTSSYQQLQPPVKAGGVLRICDMQLASDGAVFLITFSSAKASDPAFQHQVRGSVRIADREDGEAPAVAAHVFVSAASMPGKQFESLMLIEKVSGLGTGRIIDTLNHLARLALPVTYTDSAGRVSKTWLEFRQHGMQSRTLGDMLETGKLVGVDLVEHNIARAHATHPATNAAPPTPTNAQAITKHLLNESRV